MRGRFDEAASLATAPSAEHGVLDGKESAPVFIRAAATATAAAIGLSIVTAAPCLPTVSPASAAAFNRVADVAAAGLPAEVLPPIAAVNTGDVWPSLYHSAQFFSSFRPLPVPITFDEGSFADRSGFAAPPLVYTYPSTDASVETRNEPLTARAVAESSAVPASLPVSLPASLPAALPASLPAGNFALPAPSAAVLRVPPSGAAVTSAPVALEFPAAPAASADAGKEAAGSAGADAGAGADVVLGVNVSVLKAAFGTVFKLFGICAFVVCLQKSGILPKSTPSVLSQVSFRVLIPCFLMTKVAATLSGESLSALAVLPLIAILQVLVGTVLGKAACLVAFHKPSSLLPSAALLPSLVTGNTSSSSSSSSGSNSSSKNNLKHSDGTSRETHTEPVSTAAEPASTAAAVSTALASAEAAAAALRTKESVVTAVCAFSNSLSLPLVFLTALLSQVDGDRAAGYLALFMMGWQPALWTIGYSILKDAGKPAGGASSSSTKATATSGAGHAAAAGGGVGGVRAWASNAVECVSGVAKKVFNPPMYGVLVGVVIGTTPLGHFFLPAAADAAAAATAAAAGSGDLLSSLFGPATAGVLHPLFGAAGMLGGACVPVQTIVLSSSLADALPANLSWPKFLPALPNLPTPPNPFANLQKSLSAKFPAPVFPAGSPPLADLHHLLQSLLTPSSSSSSSSHPASSPSYSSSSSSDSASSLWLLARLVPHQPFLGNSVLAASYSTAAAAAATASAASASVIAGGASAAVLAIPVQGIVERGAEGLERGAEGLERGEDGLERGEDGLKQVRSCEAESNTEAVGGVAMMGGGDATGALEVNGLDALELEMDLSMGQGAAMQLERPNTDAATGTAATASEAAAVGDAGAEGFPAAAAAVGEDVAAPIRSVAPTTPVATPVTMSPELAAALAPATAAALAPSSSAVFAHAAATPTASPQSIASATSPAAAVPASSALPAAVPAGGGGAAAAAAAPATAPALAGPQADLLDNRALVVVSLVRLLVSPIVGMTSIMALYHAHLIPQDPICVLCLMVRVLTDSISPSVKLQDPSSGRSACLTHASTVRVGHATHHHLGHRFPHNPQHPHVTTIAMWHFTRHCN
ncbi:unnamed protein product [Closterium sp. Yama58-4]|nr:unnamed protein product [Closterium sp. Yama58-4]